MNQKFDKKYFSGKDYENFRPVKLVTKWSRSLSFTYLVLVDFRNSSGVKDSVLTRDRIAEKIIGKWRENHMQSFLISQTYNG